MARKKKKAGKRGYRSKAQVRWAFATKQSFARRWAHEAKVKKGKKVWYRSLPNKKRGPRKRKR